MPGLGRWAFQAVLIITSPGPTTQHHRTQRGKCYSFATSHNTGGEGEGVLSTGGGRGGGGGERECQGWAVGHSKQF